MSTLSCWRGDVFFRLLSSSEEGCRRKCGGGRLSDSKGLRHNHIDPGAGAGPGQTIKMEDDNVQQFEWEVGDSDPR